MSSIKTFIKLLKSPKKMIGPLGKRGLLNWLPSELYLKLLYEGRLGKKLELKEPKTFNEKIQWLKINDFNPEYIGMVDKLAAKQKVGSIIGEEHIVPLLAKWDSVDEIDFSKLPDKCVLKCNHDQGSTIIYDRIKGSNEEDIIRFYKKKLNKNQYYETREYPYKYIAPCIMCEPYLAKDIIDYKFFCCNGRVTMINIGQIEHKDHITHITFLDKNWKLMPFQRSDFPRVTKLPPKPNELDIMVEIAEKLATGTKFVRIDLFLIDGNIYFSEFTLYPTSGLIQFDPVWGDEYLGEAIKIR